LSFRGERYNQGVRSAGPLFGCVLLMLISQASAFAQCDGKLPPDPFIGRTALYRHAKLNESIRPGTQVGAGEEIFTVAPLPTVITYNGQASFEEASANYNAGNFTAALELLGALEKEDPHNPFILNDIARTLYRLARREESFQVYSKLQEVLKRGYSFPAGAPALQGTEVPGENQILIDLWFVESYWKIGSLHMDREEWDLAIENISVIAYLRFQSMQKLKTSQDRLLAEQAFSYLTEAYYFKQNVPLNHFFYCRTRLVNPANTYVEKYRLTQADGRTASSNPFHIRRIRQASLQSP